MSVTKKKLLNRVKNESRKTKQELSQKMSSSGFWTEVFRTLALIGFYYFASIGLTFYQSWLLKRLQFPLTIVLIHFTMKFAAAGLCRFSFTVYTGIKRVSLGWSNVLGKIGLVAVVASLDIALSQWSFEFIDVALYTITKSTSIVFILMFSILFRLEKKHWSLILIVLMISLGLAMFTYKSTEFVFAGFVMVLSASFLSGIRWTMSQLIMQKSQLGLSNPIDMIYHVQPVMIIVLLPFTLAFEGVKISSSTAFFRFDDGLLFLSTMARVCVGGIIAFFMEVAEYLLVSHTSGLTLSVAGIVKEIISLGLAIIIEKTDISPVNAIGLVICMSGITLHVVRKVTNMEKTDRPIITQGRFRGGAKSGSGGGLLSGSENSSDSEAELFHSGSVRHKPATEEIFLKDHRQWTSTRDSHMENLYRADTSTVAPPISNYNSLRNENCVITHDMVDIDTNQDNEDEDAIAEADKLLDQLDLLSSD